MNKFVCKQGVTLFWLGLIFCPALAFTLETEPWLGNQYEFDFESLFIYSRYHKVEGASKQLKSPSNDYDLFFDLGFTPYPVFDVRAEIELAETPRQSFNWRSAAIQGRFQWLNDIAGDPVSLTTGLNIRAVPHHSLRDVSCPYASYANYELTMSVGKEWSKEGEWTMRTYGYATAGIANHGSPWTQELFTWQFNWQDTHALSLFAAGDFGFGSKQHVNVHHFNGWGEFQHQSVDLGIAYRYQISIWGTLTVSYAHRVFAHNFPEHVNFFALAYYLPFSLF
jgi:hypothetical protein